MKVKPLRDRIIVKRLEEEAKTKGGIIIPDSAKEKPQEGEIVAIGSGKILDDGKLIPLEVKTGDRVLFGKYAGTEIKMDGEDFLMMKEEDILGIIQK
jgi:chaperonin GroES